MLCLILHGMVLHADLYNRAPDTLPGTLPEMREPSYWIAHMADPDGIILTAVEIAGRNDRYIRRMSADDRFKGIHPGRVPDEWQLNRWPCRFFVRPDIESMSPAELSVLVKEQIRKNIDFVRASKYGNYLAVEYSDREIDEFISRMALDSVPDEPVIRDGIAVCTTQLRVVPTFFPAEVGLTDSGSGNYSIDKWTSNAVKIGRPVSVLHRSVNGSHVFVLSDDNFGWVDSSDIAFGHKNEIREYGDSEDFLICTGNRVPFYSDKRCEYVSGWLAMGDRVSTGSLSAEGNPRLIRVPVRSTGGTFSTETAWLAEDADVHAGFMPYTRRNIIETAFKLLDDPYDWTLSTLGRNHESTYRDIFACFGFRLPHNGGLFTHYGDKDVAAMPDMGRDRQLAMVMDNEPFVSLVVSRGHAMLYLGEYNGEPVGFDQNGYGYTDDDGVRFEVKRCSIIDTSIIGYFLKNPITFLELK
jgi:hypothetical protein